MVLTYLVLSILLVVGLVLLGRRVDGGRRSVARYHKAMDVLAEITHGDAPSDAKLPARRSRLTADVAPPLPTKSPQRALPPRRPAPRPYPESAARPDQGGEAPSRSARRRRFVFVDEAVPSEHRRPARPVDDRTHGSSPRRSGPSSLTIRRGEIPSRRDRPWTGVVRRRPWVFAAATGFVVVVVVGLVAASLAGTGSPAHRSGPDHATSRSTLVGAAPAPTTPATAATSAPTVPPTTTSPPAPAGGGPTLSAISPDLASPGQTVTIKGDGLVSSDNVIVAMFGAETAPTHCPTQQQCVVTVPPPPPGSPSVPVEVRTSTGMSNAVTFHYSPSSEP